MAQPATQAVGTVALPDGTRIMIGPNGEDLGDAPAPPPEGRSAIHEGGIRAIGEVVPAMALFAPPVAPLTLAGGAANWLIQEGLGYAAEKLMPDGLSPETTQDNTLKMLLQAGHSQEDAEALLTKHWDENANHQTSPLNSFTERGVNIPAEKWGLGGAYDLGRDMVQEVPGLDPRDTSHLSKGEQKLVGGMQAAGALVPTLRGLGIPGAGAAGMATAAAGAAYEGEGFDEATPEQRTKDSYNQALMSSLIGSLGLGGAKALFNSMLNKGASKADDAVSRMAEQLKPQGVKLRSDRDPIDQFADLTHVERREYDQVVEAATNLGIAGKIAPGVALGARGADQLSELAKVNPVVTTAPTQKALQSAQDATEFGWQKVRDLHSPENPLPVTAHKQPGAQAEKQLGGLMTDFAKERTKAMKDYVGKYDKFYAQGGKLPIHVDRQVVSIMRDWSMKNVANFEPEVLKTLGKLLKAHTKGGVMSAGGVAKLIKQLRQASRRLDSGITNNSRDPRNQIKHAIKSLEGRLARQQPDFKKKMDALDEGYAKDVIARYYSGNRLSSKLTAGQRTNRNPMEPHQLRDAIVNPKSGAVSRDNYEAIRRGLPKEDAGKFDDLIMGQVRSRLDGSTPQAVKRSLAWIRDNDWVMNDPRLSARVTNPVNGAVGAMLSKVLKQDPNSQNAKKAIEELISNPDAAQSYRKLIERSFGPDGVKLAAVHMVERLKNSAAPHEFYLRHREAMGHFMEPGQMKNLDDLSLVAQQVGAFGKRGGFFPRGIGAAAGAKNYMQTTNSFLQKHIGIRVSNLFSAMRQAWLRHQSGSVSGAFFASKAAENVALKETVQFLVGQNLLGNSTGVAQALRSGKLPKGMEKTLAARVEKFINKTADPVPTKGALIGWEPDSGTTRSEQFSPVEEQIEDDYLLREQLGYGATRNR